MEIAIIYDIKKEYIKAVEAYTTLIRNNDTIPDYYINLSFLYWSFAFELYEFITPNNIPEYLQDEISKYSYIKKSFML